MKIQTISDIITNSSSEIFCTIHSDNRELIEELYDQIYSVFGWNQESERTPVISYPGENEHESWEYDYDMRHASKEDEPKIDKSTIEIEMPYCLRKVISYHKAGIDALISECAYKHNVNKEDIKVEYNEDF